MGKINHQRVNVSRKPQYAPLPTITEDFKRHKSFASYDETYGPEDQSLVVYVRRQAGTRKLGSVLRDWLDKWKDSRHYPKAQAIVKAWIERNQTALKPRA